jgi:hypothetical protein
MHESTIEDMHVHYHESETWVTPVSVASFVLSITYGACG